MTNLIPHQLELGKKLLLAAAALAAIASPIVFGVFHPVQSLAQSPATQRNVLVVQLDTTPSRAEMQIRKPDTTLPIFEIASIKPVKSNRDIERIEFTPDGFTAATVTLRDLIRSAYGVEDNIIVGGPGANLAQPNASLTTNACFKRSWRIASGLPFTT